MSAECLLLENAKKIAKQRHLDTSKIRCGAIGSCDGTSCIYLAEEGSEGSTQGQERFFRRLQATRDLHSQAKGMART